MARSLYALVRRFAEKEKKPKTRTGEHSAMNFEGFISDDFRFEAIAPDV